MLYTKEHYELLDQFERDFSSGQQTARVRLERADKEWWPRRQFYNHGETNALFLAYSSGYAFGRVIGREEAA